jgi:uncharacterized protein (DUF1810 family)
MDTYDLQRFVDAQEEGGTYERALSELRAGRKTSHWMWCSSRYSTATSTG